MDGIDKIRKHGGPHRVYLHAKRVTQSASLSTPTGPTHPVSHTSVLAISSGRGRENRAHSMCVVHIHALHLFCHFILWHGPKNEVDAHLRWTAPYQKVVG